MRLNSLALFLVPGSREGLLIFTNADGGHGVYEPLIRQYLGEAGKAILRIEMGR